MNRGAVKICGMTTAEAMRAAADAGAGFVGFITHPRSPRYLAPPDAAALAATLPDTVASVLVTVNISDETLTDYLAHVQPKLLQLHGQETPQRCSELRERYGLPLIKAGGIASVHDLEALNRYAPVADYLLLDTKRTDGSSGGTGQPFDWSLIANNPPQIPWFLSGGIGPANVEAAHHICHPPLLDVSSSLESSAGIKSPEKINHFMARVSQL